MHGGFRERAATVTKRSCQPAVRCRNPGRVSEPGVASQQVMSRIAHVSGLPSPVRRVTAWDVTHTDRSMPAVPPLLRMKPERAATHRTSAAMLRWNANRDIGGLDPVCMVQYSLLNPAECCDTQ